LGNRLQIHSDREGRGGIYVLVGGQTASGDVRVLPQILRQLCFDGMGLRADRPLHVF